MLIAAQLARTMYLHAGLMTKKISIH